MAGSVPCFFVLLELSFAHGLTIGLRYASKATRDAVRHRSLDVDKIATLCIDQHLRILLSDEPAEDSSVLQLSYEDLQGWVNLP